MKHNVSPIAIVTAACLLVCLVIACAFLPWVARQYGPGESSEYTKDDIPGDVASYPLPDVGSVTYSELSVYFRDVALSVEGSGYTDTVKKWVIPMRYSIEGTMTDRDREVFAEVTSAMNSVPGFPGIYEAAPGEEPNLKLYFCDDEWFENSFFRSKNVFAIFIHDADLFGGKSDITSASIAFRCSMSQEYRNAVIWEELLQASGLMNDSFLHEDSLFYQEHWKHQDNGVQKPTELDWLLFQFLYHPAIRPGMTFRQCQPMLWGAFLLQ